MADLVGRWMTGSVRNWWRSRCRRIALNELARIRLRHQLPTEEVRAATVVDSVTRAVCLVDELATLPELVEEIEVAGVSAGPAELAAGIRELIEHLRVQAAAIASLADRLE